MARATPILVFNAGSATLKYRLIDDRHDLIADIVEHIGEPGGPADHGEAAAAAIAKLGDDERVHDHIRRLAAVGHRVVHGGDRLHEPTIVDDGVEAAIDAFAPLAPAHNPAALAVIRAARRAYPEVPHVAVFDTAFHATLPAAAATYPVDRDVAAAHGIRRYGFHGISVRYVRDRAAELLGRPAGELNMVVLHLGNGASATALAGGVSVDTSMGMTPLAGLVMGSRSGDLDPAITFHLIRAGWAPEDVDRLYEKRSGLAGLTGDNDVRAVQSRAADGDAAADLALDVYCRAIRKYVGAYHAVLGRLDAIVFTAGVGEHSAMVRDRALRGMERLGIALDVDANENANPPCVISAGGARVAICVVPTDEEQAIAEEITQLLAVAG
ncbi:MAG TPA: acetate/propionate family kinase [Micromonosporaceae bacterium]|jgi:acetate kinase